jgi:DNA primase
LPPPDSDYQKLLMDTALMYHHQLRESPEAGEYLESRGLTATTIDHFRLGFVDDPVRSEDSKMQGRISIPYLVDNPVHGRSSVAMRFRAIHPEMNPKYLGYAGENVSLFNPLSLLMDTDYMCICEGEFDTIAAYQAGLTAVGIPGAQQWAPWMPRLLKGYKAVYVLQDADSAGKKFAEQIAKSVRNVRVIEMPDGDVNSTLIEKGSEYLKELVIGN